jgi:hypothetical protein
VTDEPKPRSCRVCNCTDDDCSGCVARTGAPCAWIAEDLCSACDRSTECEDIADASSAHIVSQTGASGAMVIVVDHRGSLHVAAHGEHGERCAPLIEIAEFIQRRSGSVVGDVVAQPTEGANCIHCKAEVARTTQVELIREHTLTCAESPAVKRIAELQGQLAAAHDAITYTLNRVQTDPDFAYYMLDTETFARLVDAEAAILGLDPEQHRRARREDHQPEHRRREADIVVLRDKLERLDAVVDAAKQWRQRFQTFEGGYLSCERDLIAALEELGRPNAESELGEEDRYVE